ncbi:hypothetical protein DV515_00000087 [Chloebia gouldiae]|uniref:Biogenesis of lysosome-related organelles complex 1 subunit 4 n=1 Tax=Chloebia gouldiae TaxID=44316 RepID=A0A3L8T0G5_CHLGU|nr:hypothetical protein DV515_00000087 [Chloebia gouldiae]
MAEGAGPAERAGAELPDACPGADSGNVSQSQSRASGLGEAEDEDASEASLSATAAAYSACLLAERSLFSEQIESLDKSLEDLLTRVDEFVGMLDMIRSDSSQVVNESIPQIYTKATEMRQIYRKIDKLEAFVKMIGNNVAGLEERVTKAETDLGAFPSTFKKILHTISMPSFLNENMYLLHMEYKYTARLSIEKFPLGFVDAQQELKAFLKESSRTFLKESFARNRLPHDSSRPSMNLQSSSRQKTIFHVLMKHLIDGFCFGIGNIFRKEVGLGPATKKILEKPKSLSDTAIVKEDQKRN